MGEDDEELVGAAFVATAVGVILVGTGGGDMSLFTLCSVGFVTRKEV